MMKILWITNIVFPEVMERLTNISGFKSSGGWMLGAANALLESNEVELYVASVSNLVQHTTRVNGESITYYILPYVN